MRVGGNKMKTFKPLATLSIFCLLCFAQTTNVVAAKYDEKDKENKLITAKCHVLLVDGNESIYFSRLPYNRFKSLSKWVVGKKVLPEKSMEKVKVYNAFQCVLKEDEFSDVKAQLLDKKVEY